MLDELDLATRITLQLFQHDGTPPHNHIDVRNHHRVLQTYQSRIFLWGTVKNRIYKNNYNTLEELRIAVGKAFINLDRRSVLKASNSVLKKCNMCINNNGNTFEHLI